MAQFVLDTSELDVDVLGPITFATANATLGSLMQVQLLGLITLFQQAHLLVDF